MIKISAIARFALVAISMAYLYQLYYYGALNFFIYKTETELPPQYEFKLCIMSRIKNAARFLPQWIEYHKIAGIDHYFFTNDCSEDDDKMTYWANFYARFGYVTYFRNLTVNNCTHQAILGRTIGSSPQLDFLLSKAKHRCEWLTVIDPDEYLLPTDEAKHFRMFRKGYETPESFSLKPYLENRKTPVFRLPWYASSNLGYEHAPKGFIIDDYNIGKFDEKDIIIKSMIKSVYIKRWNDSHFPTEYEAFAPNISRISMKNFVMDFRYRTSEIQKFSYRGYNCIKPKGVLTLKHFMILSWQEFASTRGNRSRNSEGNIDGWSMNPRATWESWNFTSPCPQLGDRYRQGISKLMLASMQKNLAQFRGTTAPYDGISVDFERMLQGEKLT